MDIYLDRVNIKDKEILYRLLEYSLFEESLNDGNEMNEQAIFEYKYFDTYFNDNKRDAFFTREKQTNKLLGFVMKLNDIDVEIFNCNKCTNMVEKFPNLNTVSIGKNSDIVILGEAPANNGWRKSGVAWYDVNGKLLPSGVVLEKLLQEINIKIEDTCFLEAIKCYPKDRKYLSMCGKNCKEYLFKQLYIIKPKVVLSLGDSATKTILDIKYNKFSDVVGKEYDVNGIKVIPIYHPSPISPMSYKGNIDIVRKLKL